MQRITGKLMIASDFFKYLWRQGKYILILTLVFLVVFGALLFFVQSQVTPSPFIYTLF